MILALWILVVCAIPATMSLFMIVSRLGKLVGKIDDQKRELEEMKRQLNQETQSEPQS